MLFLLPILIAVLVWLAALKVAQRKRFVRAAEFLSRLEAGETVSDANAASSLLFTRHCPDDLRSLATERANREAAINYNGKQMPLIEFALSKGFEG
ncbi:hypothetical protein SU32_11610 [Ahrensia marina]|uniref:Uncharacterized protein n=1 Tax=Ahrensia marina TaxID=1514904 RepID=A0A0M9GMD6_9HYPH|nr:hypothetical protein SU32_11610 [Ahrensia marina]